MTNEEKVKNMTKGFLSEGLIKKSRLQELLIKAMEWKEQILINKACEWMEDNAINYVGKDGITAWRSVYADFRKAMKGGGNENN